MHKSDAFPSTYLKQEDLPRPPKTVEALIEDVRIETMPGDSDEKPVMYFANGDLKPMILNATNWEIIESVLGEESDRWRGQPIELYVDPNVMYAGKRTGGIRVRCNGAVPTTWPLARALEECSKHGVDVNDLRAEITAAGGTGWNPERDTPIVKRLLAAATEGTPAVQEHAPVSEDDIPF